MFAKGQSGNPGGRPKVPPEVKELLESKTLYALQRLVELLDSPDEKVRMAAAVAILDRRLGKPSQSVVHSGDEDAPPIRQRIERVIVKPSVTNPDG